MNLPTIEEQMRLVLQRNIRVEQDKAWEVSSTRRAFITAVTYGIACYYLWLIGIADFWFHAVVPAGGYLLSTLSLPWIKKWWIEKQTSRSDRYDQKDVINNKI